MTHLVCNRLNASKHLSTSFVLFCWAVVVLVISELIGPVAFNILSIKFMLLPMIWALIAGALVGIAGNKFKYPLLIRTEHQNLASELLQPALLFFTAKLGLVVGQEIPVIISAGWALLFQEFGHFLGTIILGMPLALLLGIKREAIGATFSVGREPNLAIISERYGMNSPEGRGVMAEYITGTLLGSVFISIVAGIMTSLHLFDPRSLAMASGVGSGSMMAAASGTIAAQSDAKSAQDIMALAAASNLITSTFGTYFTLFISLPLAIFAYKFLEPILGRGSRIDEKNSQLSESENLLQGNTKLSWRWKILAWSMTAVLSLLSGFIGSHQVSLTMVVGCLLLVIISILGDCIYILLRGKIPSVCIVSLIAMLITSPWCPWAKYILSFTGSLNTLFIITPMLTLAGLSIARDLSEFRKLGWRIIVVSLMSNLGTFVGSAAIAEIFL
ncbi:DUF3100 domain-containing protein [Tatumella sp. JGM118]|uniref:DUF3100 domain-containing protein n=1 Tax=Tatumella terrea TaxID=419007 RepID=A0ABW1VWI3_9GAMM|nr:DUF3100 domain-containing protein [Tatumella sp. JGM118]MBS0909535.1 DUF3100 domain-containing protein [Tatumella sp. JGM118]